MAHRDRPNRKRPFKERVKPVRIVVREHVLAISDVFTLADLTTATGANPKTVRREVDELIAAGLVVELGRDPAHRRPGSTPLQFRVADTTTPSC